MATTPTPATGHDLGRFAKPKEIMRELGYSDRGAFWQFVRRSGVPHIRLNLRRIVFDRDALNAWLAARSVGGRTGR